MSNFKIIFVTGTRADFGKLLPLIQVSQRISNFEIEVFVTGMHMLRNYGSTYKAVERYFKSKVYKSFNNKLGNDMALVCSETMKNFHNYIKKRNADLVVLHGDRVETLACATVAALSNIRICHIEGGEVSGTIDESIRHAVSKFSQIHLVCNQAAKKRLQQLGELEDSIEILGSPDIDIMFNSNLPKINSVKKHYAIEFKKYAILIFHPTTTSFVDTKIELNGLLDAIKKDENNYVVVYPNNDTGSELIIKNYKKKLTSERFRIIPSIEFKSFLVLLKNSKFIIGNSSAGVREAPVYGIPTINIGARQNNRAKFENIIQCSPNTTDILSSISKIKNYKAENFFEFGDGQSSIRFKKFLMEKRWLNVPIQKKFNDIKLP